MRKEIKFMTFILTVVLALAFTAFAQERTGSIEGTVKDQNGAVVPNATVVVEGNAYNRTVTSNDDGFFRLAQVPPGAYTVTISAGNFQKETRNNVTVVLGNSTTVETELKTSVGAVVNVTTEGVTTIDTTSSKIQTDLGAKRLEVLPKGNNFTTALKAAAPVRVEPTAGGFQIDGASGSENAFVVDGQEVTNFRDGTLNNSNNIPFQLIQEVQVKSNGFEAEFGGATGGVINVVTKRGQNDFHGEINTAFETSKLWAGNRRVLTTSTAVAATAPNRYIYPKRDIFLNNYPSFYAGGSIIKNHLYYFGTMSPQFLNTTRPFTATNGQQFNYRQQIHRDYSFGRLDGQLTDKLQLTGTYLYNPVTTHGNIPAFTTLAGGALPLADQAALGGRDASQIYTFEGIYTPTQNISLDVRYGRGYLNEKTFNTNTGAFGYGIQAVTQYTCPSFSCSAGGAGFANVSSNSFINKDISIRKTLDATAGIYVPNLGGRHNFRVGYQYTGLSNDVDIGNVSFGTLTFFIDPTATTFDQNGNVRPNAADKAAGVIGYGQLALVGTFGKASSRNDALFAQDSYQIGKRLTLNLGIRAEKEDVPSFKAGANGIKFSWKDKLAPRLGVAFDVLGNGKWKVFASYGRFFDRFKYELPRGSFGGEKQDIYDFLVTNPNIFSYTRDGVIAAKIRFQDQRTAANDPADNRVDPNLKPFQQQEVTFGTAYDFGNGFILDGRYTRKNIIRAIDDIGYHNLVIAGGKVTDFDSEEYFIGNPGEGVCALPACGRYTIPGDPGIKAKRVYNAVEVRLQRRFFTNLAVDANYTYSRLFGNYTGSASSDEAQRGGGVGRNSPAVSRYFDLPFLGYTLAGTPDDGLLPTDRPHFFKVAASYNFDWYGSKTNSTALNAFYSLGSGTPVTTRVRYAVVSGQILSARGDLGRTHAFDQLDMSLTHKYRFGRDARYTVAFDLNVLNVINKATEISRRETLTRNEFPASAIGCNVTPAVGSDQTPLRCLDRAVFNGKVTPAIVLAFANAAGGGNLDTRYNLPQTFQAPRAVRLGFRFIF